MIKKIYCLLLLVFLSSFGYASQKTLSIENNRLVWDYAGSLPAQKGFDKNIGTAGLLQGIIGDYIVVGGGANFPEALEKGGKKVTHKDLYLLKDVNGKLKTIEQIQLDYPIAYGASVSVKEENAIYYLGGSPDSEHMRDVLKVTLKNGKLKTEIYAKLPLGFENGVAQYKDGKIYYGVGKIENSEGKNVNSNKLGGTVAKRNENLVNLINGVGDMKLGDYQENTIDAFGDAYEYLMGMYASNAGKSGGEYYTPQEVSELLTKLTLVGKTEVNNQKEKLWKEDIPFFNIYTEGIYINNKKEGIWIERDKDTTYKLELLYLNDRIKDTLNKILPYPWNRWRGIGGFWRR